MDPDLLGNLLDQHAAWLPTRSRPARCRKPSRRGSRPCSRRGPRNYLLGILPEVLSTSTSPFPVIVPLGEGADAKAIGQLLCGGGTVKGPVTLPTCATVHNAVFAGTNEALERVRQLKPVERPELAAAFATLGDTGAELVLTPSADTRRVVEEMLPILPKELGGGPITSVTRGLLWTAAGSELRIPSHVSRSWSRPRMRTRPRP